MLAAGPTMSSLRRVGAYFEVRMLRESKVIFHVQAGAGGVRWRRRRTVVRVLPPALYCAVAPQAQHVAGEQEELLRHARPRRGRQRAAKALQRIVVVQRRLGVQRSAPAVPGREVRDCRHRRPRHKGRGGQRLFHQRHEEALQMCGLESRDVREQGSMDAAHEARQLAARRLHALRERVHTACPGAVLCCGKVTWPRKRQQQACSRAARAWIIGAQHRIEKCHISQVTRSRALRVWRAQGRKQRACKLHTAPRPETCPTLRHPFRRAENSLNALRRGRAATAAAAKASTDSEPLEASFARRPRRPRIGQVSCARSPLPYSKNSCRPRRSTACARHLYQHMPLARPMRIPQRL